MHRARSLSMRSAGSGSAIVVALNPAAWFRYGIGITVTGSGVSQWSDQSGNGRHLLQAVDASRPPRQADDSILFDGVDDYLKTAPFTLNQPWSAFLLFKQNSWTLNDYILDGNTLSSGTVYQSATVPRIRQYAGVDGTENANLAGGVYGVVSAVFNGASSFFQVNNTTGTTDNVGAANAGGITLGAPGNALGQFFNGQFKEVVVFPSVLGPNDFAAVKSYLGNIAGLTL